MGALLASNLKILTGNAHSDPFDYQLISLLSGTKTRTTRAQERLIAANPDLVSQTWSSSRYLPADSGVTTQDHNLLPSHLLEAKNKTNLTFGQEYHSIRKELAAAANVLFSVGGVGGAVFVVAKTSAGLRPEKVRRQTSFFRKQGP